MQTEHTPTPWQFWNPTSCIKHKEDRWDIAQILCRVNHDEPFERLEADGEFIVLACNAHDAILDTCKDLREHLREYLKANTSPPRMVITDMVMQLNTAINKAGG